jgi:ribonuclease HII
MKRPSVSELLSYETKLWNEGYSLIAGIDEAGRGPLAGPVVSACVIFPPSIVIEGVYDSKALSANQREKLYENIIEKAVAYGIGIVDNNTIDRINIFEATKLSMLNAVDRSPVKPDCVLIDAVRLELGVPVQAIIKGDQKSFTIAAASILAKVTRDRMMRKMHEEYPVYGWEQNKGYPTRAHKDAIRVHGFSPYHRRTFNSI